MKLQLRLDTIKVPGGALASAVGGLATPSLAKVILTATWQTAEKKAQKAYQLKGAWRSMTSNSIWTSLSTEHTEIKHEDALTTLEGANVRIKSNASMLCGSGVTTLEIVIHPFQSPGTKVEIKQDFNVVGSMLLVPFEVQGRITTIESRERPRQNAKAT